MRMIKKGGGESGSTYEKYYVVCSYGGRGLAGGCRSFLGAAVYRIKRSEI